MTIRGPLYSNPPVPYWNVTFVNGDNSVFIVRPGKPPAATNYYWPLTPDIRELRNYTFSEIPARIPPPNKPFNQYNWPLPTPPSRLDETWFESGNTLPPLPLQNPFSQSNWPNPTPPSIPVPTVIVTPFIGNIPPPNKPFKQTDWPLPPSGPYRIEQTWIESGNAFPPFPVQGFNQTDWPNPVQPSRIQQTWIQTPFTGSIPPPIKPFNTTDWPLPVQPYRIDQTWYESGNNLPPVNPPPASPFNQFYWPLTPASTPIDPTWIVEGIGGGIVQPFSQTDWPLPVQPSRIDSTWIETGNVYYVTPQVPFKQTDWPNPRDPRDYRSWTWETYPGNIPPPSKPFNVTDWPLPTQPSRIEQTWLFPHTVINPPLPIPAGSNYDWPNPREFRDYRNWTWTEYPGIIPPPNKPFNVTDWPIPGAYPRPDETYIWFFPGFEEGGIPHNQYDWPLPGRYQTPDGTWVHVQQISPFVQSPFNQTDWPNPRGYPIPDGTWVNPGILISPTVPMPLLASRENQVFLPKFFSIDSIPVNFTPSIPPPPIVILTGGGKWRDAVNEWKKDSDVKIKEAAAHMASLGGKARAKSLTSTQRSNIASTAAKARWK